MSLAAFWPTSIFPCPSQAARARPNGAKNGHTNGCGAVTSGSSRGSASGNRQNAATGPVSWETLRSTTVSAGQELRRDMSEAFRTPRWKKHVGANPSLALVFRRRRRNGCGARTRLTPQEVPIDSETWKVVRMSTPQPRQHTMHPLPKTTATAARTGRPKREARSTRTRSMTAPTIASWGFSCPLKFGHQRTGCK